MIPNRSWLCGVLVGAAAMPGCSTPPPPAGSVVRMDVVRQARAFDVDPNARFLTEADRRALRVATSLPGLVAAGRVVVTRCTMGDGGLVFAHAVVEGAMPQSGEAVMVRLGDREAGDPDLVVGKVPGIERGNVPYEIVAYRTVVPWSTRAIEGDISPFVQAQYGKIQSGRVIRCVAP